CAKPGHAVYRWFSARHLCRGAQRHRLSRAACLAFRRPHAAHRPRARPLGGKSMTWIDDLFAALTDTTAWPEYAARMIQHLGISFLAVLIAALIAIPAGTAIGHTGRGSLLVGGVSGAARALPTLG